MINASEVLTRPPDDISECGEEVWRNIGSDFSLVRLQYKARITRSYLAISQQRYLILQGSPTLELNQEFIQLRTGSMVTFVPGDIYQLVNKTFEDVILVCLSNIEWNLLTQQIH